MPVHAGLSALGRDALSAEELTVLVRKICGDSTATPEEVWSEPVDYPIGTPSTEALFRVFGRMISAEGDAVDWSCFVKKFQSARRWAMIESVPEDIREGFIHNLPWRLELAVHRSNIAELLPDGMRLPALYRADVYDERATLWMENVDVDQSPWRIERFGQAAYLLGSLSARRQAHLVEPLVPRDHVRTPGINLRFYAEGLVKYVVPTLADPETWQRPLLREAVAAVGDTDLRQDLMAMAGRIPAVLKGLEALPQCYQHGDASPQNLLVSRNRPDEFVVIDWSFDCPLAVGFDLGQLLIGLAHAGQLAPEVLPEVHQVILKSFHAGLTAEGMRVAETDVLYGYLGSLLVRAGFTALPLEQFSKTPATRDQFEQRVRLTRAIIDLAAIVV